MAQATERIVNQKNSLSNMEANAFISKEKARVNAWETGLEYAKKAVNDTVDAGKKIYTVLENANEQKNENDFKKDIAPELMKFEATAKDGMKNGTIAYGDIVDHLYNDEYERLFNDKYSNLTDKQREKKKKDYEKYVDSRKYSFFEESKQYYPLQVERELDNNAKLTGEQVASGESDSFFYDFYTNIDSYSKYPTVANTGEDWKVYSNSNEIRDFDAYSRTRNLNTEDRIKFIKENYSDVYDKAVKAVGKDASPYSIIGFIAQEASTQKSRALALAQQENMAFQILKTGQSVEYAIASIDSREDEFSENVNMGIFVDLVNTTLENANNDYSAFEKYQISPETIDPATGKPFNESLRKKLNDEYSQYAKAVIEKDVYDNSTAFVNNVLPSLTDAITNGQITTSQNIVDLLENNGIRHAGLTDEIKNFLADITTGLDNKFKVDNVIQNRDLSLGDIDAFTKVNLFRVEFDDEDTMEMISVGLDSKALPKSPIGISPEDIIKSVSEMETYPTNRYDSKTGLPLDLSYAKAMNASEEMRGQKYEYDTAMSYAKLYNIEVSSDLFDVNADQSTHSVVTIDKIGKMLNLVGFTEAGSKIETDGETYSIKLINGETVKFGSYEELRQETYNAMFDFVSNIAMQNVVGKWEIQKEKLAGYSEEVQEAFGALMQSQIMNEAEVDRDLMFREITGTVQRIAMASIYDDLDNWMKDLYSRVAPNSTDFNNTYGISLSKIDAKQMIDKAYQTGVDNLVENAKKSKYGILKVENSLPIYGSDGKPIDRKYSYFERLTERYPEGHPLAGQYKTDLNRVISSAMLDPNLSEKDTDEITKLKDYISALSEGGKADPVMRSVAGIINNSFKKFGNTSITPAQQGFVFRALYRALENTAPDNIEAMASNFESAWSAMTAECIENTKDKTKSNYLNQPTDAKFQDACTNYASQINDGNNILSTSGMVEEFKYSLIKTANEDEASGRFLEGYLIEVDNNGKIKNKNEVYRQAILTTCKALNVDLGISADEPDFINKVSSFLTGNPLEFMIMGFAGMIVEERRKSATMTKKSDGNVHEINYVNKTTSYSTDYTDKPVAVDNETGKIVGTNVNYYQISENGMDKQSTTMTTDINYELKKEMLSRDYASKYGYKEIPNSRSVYQIIAETQSVIASRKMSDEIFKNTNFELIPVHRIDIKLSDDNQYIVEVRSENVKRAEYEDYNPLSIRTGENLQKETLGKKINKARIDWEEERLAYWEKEWSKNKDNE